MTPAQALGHDLLSRGYRVEVLTDKRGMTYQHLFEGMPFHVLRSGTLGAGLMGKVMGVFNLGLGVLHARSLVHSMKPAMVVGFGGYPSVPGVYAAQAFKVPSIIHEQNAIIGRANAFLAAKATRIALSLPEVQGLDEAERVRAVFTGNPVRPEIASLFTKPYPNIDENSALKIFIMGGSLGARVFSDVVPVALASLPQTHRSRLYIVQQCREDQIEEVRKVYQEAGIEAELATFFDDVAQRLEDSHLVICRSGASTVAEVATAGRPAIFVPYPHHKDQQQKMNADVIGDAGGGWVMTESGFTAETLASRIETFLQNPSVLFKAAENARSCGRPDAARKLGNLVTAIVSGWGDE